MRGFRVLAAGGTDVTGTDGIVFIVLLIAFIAISTYLTFIRTRDRSRLAIARLAADVDKGLGYLDSRITATTAAVADPADDVARALADAGERLAAARELRAQSQGAAVLRAVRHTLLEGLAAVWEARKLAGLDPGPQPPAPSDAPTTAEPVEVSVEGITQRAEPSYCPGYPYHFAGGSLAGVSVPGGWYAEPFWEALLLAP